MRINVKESRQVFWCTAKELEPRHKPVVQMRRIHVTYTGAEGG